MGTTEVTYQGETYDFANPIERMTVEQAILKYNPDFNKAKIRDRDYLESMSNDLGFKVKDSYGAGKLQIEIFEKTCESKLRQPTFIKTMNS